MADNAKSFLDPVHLLSAHIRKINPDPPSIPRWFEKELTQMGGKTSDGRPKLKLVWGGSEVQWSRGRWRIKYPKFTKKFVVGWEAIRFYADGEGKQYAEPGPSRKPVTELLPPEAANDPANGVGRLVYDWLDVGKPRWIVEKWLPPEIACKGWPKDGDFGAEAIKIRYAYDDNLGWIDVIGPPPVKGLYVEWQWIDTPLGEYKHPDEEVMAALRRQRWREREQFGNLAPGERPPDWVIQQRLRDRYDEVAANEEKWAEAIGGDIWQHMRPSYKAALNNNGTIFLPK
jgi:hypothetical protein